ncbi:hypothetical protein WKY82_10345 [Gordonia malaquae]|uniref:hypothetical protein n=1 Tax=Gordonia malaquae TaxID=410332 RepID=UPI0030C79E47
MSIYLFEFALFSGIAIAALVLHHTRRHREQTVPLLMVVAAAAASIAIGGPGSGLADAAVKAVVHPRLPYVPHAFAAVLMVWASTRLLPIAAAAYQRGLRDRFERIRQIVLHVAVPTIVVMWACSMIGGVTAEIAWLVIGFGTWVTCYAAACASIALVGVSFKDIVKAREWIAPVSVLGLGFFGFASFVCVIFPDQAKPQIVAGIGIALIMTAAAGARRVPAGTDR